MQVNFKVRLPSNSNRVTRGGKGELGASDHFEACLSSVSAMKNYLELAFHAFELV